jgi:acyl-CoA hydrolase
MFSDGVIDLIENDVINCNYKGTLRGRALATFLVGSKRLYDFVNDNPFIEMKESSMVNDTARIRKNPKMVAINSAIEVDVTGQVVPILLEQKCILVLVVKWILFEVLL